MASSRSQLMWAWHLRVASTDALLTSRSPAAASQPAGPIASVGGASGSASSAAIVMTAPITEPSRSASAMSPPA
jgi:hypothetical protein